MTTAINLADEADLDRVLSLMTRYHAEAGLPYDDPHRAAAVAPLLDGSPLGAIWLVGPTRAPLGYVMITFGWSMAQGGMVGWLDEAFIRESVRNRGIGTEVMHAITVNLRSAGLKAMHVQLGPDAAAAGFCKRCGFQPVDATMIMTDVL